MKLEPIWPGAGFGVKIAGWDGSSDFKSLLRIIHQYKVVVLSEQLLSSEGYIAFAKGLGELVPFNFKNYSAEGCPEIMILDNQAHVTGVGGRKVGNMWHSDSSYLKRPLDLTLLLAKTAPDPRFGGNTLFVDANRVLAQLDPELRAKLKTLKARHEVLWTYKITQGHVGQSLMELVDELRAKNGFSAHPCVSAHPHTGKETLYVNPGYTTGIEGLSFDESSAVLEKVFAVALRSENIFSFAWKTNDLLIWDNRSVWHKATAVENSVARLMHRIGVQDVQ